MSRRTLRTRLAVGLVASTLLLTGCASSDDSPESNKTPTEKTVEEMTSGLVNVDDSGSPVKGGVLRIGEYSEARSLDPTKTYSNGAAGGSALLAIYDSLMAYNWEDGTYEPRLAESLSTDDNTTWTLKLREGVKFTDGTDLDAAAVAGSIGYYLKSYGYNFMTWASNVADMKVVDKTTIEFTTRFPWATFPNMLAHGPGLVMAPAAYKNPEKFQPIGAGPFVLDDYKPTEKLVLKANEDYFGGRPNLDALEFSWPGGDTAKVESLAAGDLDTAYLRDTKSVTEAMDEGKATGMRFVVGGGSNLWINQREGRPGAMPEVRQALNLAWDPKRYMDRVGEDSSLATKSLLPKTSPWYTGVEPQAADLDKAKELVDAAKKKGFDGKIQLLHFADASATQSATALKGMLDQAGFEVQLKALKSVADQIQAMYVTHDFDLAFSALSIGDEDPYLRLHGVTTPNSPTNTSGMDNKEIAAALTELAAASGPEDGVAALTKVEELWQADVPALNESSGIVFLPFADNVHGIVPTSETMMFYDKAWVTQ